MQKSTSVFIIARCGRCMCRIVCNSWESGLKRVNSSYPPVRLPFHTLVSVTAASTMMLQVGWYAQKFFLKLQGEASPLFHQANSTPLVGRSNIYISCGAERVCIRVSGQYSEVTGGRWIQWSPWRISPLTPWEETIIGRNALSHDSRACHCSRLP